MHRAFHGMINEERNTKNQTKKKFLFLDHYLASAENLCAFCFCLHFPRHTQKNGRKKKRTFCCIGSAQAQTARIKRYTAYQCTTRFTSCRGSDCVNIASPCMQMCTEIYFIFFRRFVLNDFRLLFIFISLCEKWKRDPVHKLSFENKFDFNRHLQRIISVLIFLLAIRTLIYFDAM